MLSIYKASAGSGKTHTLTLEYLLMLFRDNQVRNQHFMPHSHILAVTFTKKATAEMKERILLALYTLSQSPSESQFFDDLSKQLRLDEKSIQTQARYLLIGILQDYNRFSVSTIDGFFQQVIRTFAMELGLSTTYDLAMDSNEVIQQAVDDIFRKIRLQQEENQDIISWITELTQHNIEENSSTNPHKLVSTFSQQLNKEELKRNINQLREFFANKDNIRTYQQQLLQITTNTINHIAQIQQQATMLLEGVVGTRKHAVSAFLDYSATDLIEKGLNNQFLGVLDNPETLYTTTKTTKAQQQEVMQIYHNGLHLLYEEMVQTFDTEVRDYHTAQAILNHLYTVGLLQDVAGQVETTNRQLGRVPISDVNTLIHEVIDGQEAPFIYERVGQYLRHFMIDEFQDTSALQWDNFLPLINEAESKGSDNLIVGDTKQSIYRWRNSDWKLLNNVHHHFHHVQQPPMGNNWRSAKLLIHENESIIHHYAQWVDQTITQNGWKESTPLANAIASIYHTDAIHQEAKKDLPGLFQLQFFDGTKSDVEQRTLDAIDVQLRQLEQEGISWGRIAMLVRRNSDAELLANYLISKNYPVESAEGMRVQSHPAVQLLLAVMQQHLQPDNEVTQRIIQDLHAPFSEQLHKEIELAFQLPLYELVQTLIQSLELTSESSALPYLTAFQDQVYQFTKNRVSDLQAFLEYWEKKANKVTIPTSAITNAIRILTVHSSKGLEFDIVMLPFLNWDIQRIGQGEILWCKPNHEPFNQMPLVAVSLSSKLLKTHFCNEYINEIISQYIDNLNLTYVAFTRPKYRLYAYGQMYESNNNKIKISNVGQLLSYLYDQVIDTTSLLQSDEEGVYTYLRADNNPTIAPEKPNNTHTREAKYISTPIGNRLKLRSRAEDDYTQDTPLETIDLGILMHEWLENIRTWDDAPKALQQMRSEGKITAQQTPAMQEQLHNLQQLLQREGKTHWFDGSMSILTEQTILSNTGKTYRPDRIIIHQNQAEVIDYKFGNEHISKYNEQLRNYTLMLQQMGYTVDAYVVYVALQKIAKVY